MEKNYQLQKLIKAKCDCEKDIQNAQKHWRIIRSKIKVIRMMAYLGADAVVELIKNQ